GFRGCEFDPVVPGQRVQRLRLDQRDLPVLVRPVRIVSHPVGITITLDTLSGHEPRLPTLRHLGTSCCCDEHVREFTTPPHGCRLPIRFCCGDHHRRRR